MGRFVDLSGQQFNRWTILRFSHMTKNSSFFICRCICGTERAVKGSSIKTGSNQSCGCLKRDTDRLKMKHDFTGERIGRLVVLEQTEPTWQGIKKSRRWRVRCDCGKETIIQTQTLHKQKRSGYGSCGCWRTEIQRQERIKKLRPYEFYLKRIINSANNRNKINKYVIEVTLSYEQLLTLIPPDGIGKCHYCNDTVTWMKYELCKAHKHRKHGHNFDRIDNAKGYAFDNLVPCCGSCNRTRGDRYTYKEFKLFSPLLETIRIARHAA